MSYTFRVYPQPGSVGYRRNRGMKRMVQQQAHFNRIQNLQLQRQLQAFTPGGNMYGRSNFVGQYSNPFYGAANCFPGQTAYNQGIGYGYGGLGSYGYGSSLYNNPFQVSPYGYGVQPAYAGVGNLFGGLFNSLTSWL